MSDLWYLGKLRLTTNGNTIAKITNRSIRRTLTVINLSTQQNVLCYRKYLVILIIETYYQHNPYYTETKVCSRIRFLYFSTVKYRINLIERYLIYIFCVWEKIPFNIVSPLKMFKQKYMKILILYEDAILDGSNY